MKKIRTYLWALCSLIWVFSCIEEQNFDQYDDLDITPTYEASIIYLEVPESTINNVAVSNFYTQTFNFDAFEEDFFSERVLEGTITYEIENTTSKPLEITIEFVDQAGTVLDTEIFPMNAGPDILQRDVAYGPTGKSMDIITNTSGMNLTAINLGDNTSTSSQSEPLVVLKSSGKFTVRIK